VKASKDKDQIVTDKKPRKLSDGQVRQTERVVGAIPGPVAKVYRRETDAVPLNSMLVR
jgi:hypothetical protein